MKSTNVECGNSLPLSKAPTRRGALQKQMPNLTQLRLAAREIFDHTLRAVDAGAAVRRALSLDGSKLNVCDTTVEVGDRKIYSVAIGKAAVAMAHALEHVLGDPARARGDRLLIGLLGVHRQGVPECPDRLVILDVDR